MPEAYQTLDSIMTQEDKDFLEMFNGLRNHINGFLKKETLIKMVEELIDQSEYFDFATKYARRVRVERPVFSLKYDEKKINNISNGSKYQFLNSKISSDIISPLSQKVNKMIRKDKDTMNYLSEQDFFKDMPKNFNITNYLFTSIFGINFVKNEPYIHLEFMV